MSRKIKDDVDIISQNYVKTEEDDYMATPHAMYTPEHLAPTGNTSDYSAMYSEWGGNAAMTPLVGEGGHMMGGGFQSPTNYINTPSYSHSPSYEARSPIYRSEHSGDGGHSGAASPMYSPTQLSMHVPSYSPSNAMSPHSSSPNYQPYGAGASPGYSPNIGRNYTHSSPQYSPTTGHAAGHSPSYSPTTPAYQSSLSPRYYQGGSSSPIYNPTTPAYGTTNYSGKVKTEVKKEAKEEKDYKPFIPDED